jgi:cytochrome c-type protein NapB
MNKMIVGLIGTSILSLAGVNLDSCKSCHGKDWEKAALGSSKIVKDMTRSEVTEALLGYKHGTYGRALKGVMHTNVKMYSDEDLKNIGIGLVKQNVKREFNPNINIESCKSCHGADWEKPALGASKIVKDMTKEEVSEALLGYKHGTYGRGLKGVMHTNVKMYSDEDLKNSGIGLDTKIEKINVEAKGSFDTKECKECHGHDWEKPSLGSSKIVRDMTKEEVTKALLGYKNKNYGGSMKAVMEEKVKIYSIEQLKNSGIGK